MRFSSLAQPIALSLRLRGGADQTAGKDNVIVFRVSFFIETKNTHYVSFLRMLCNHVFCGKFSLLAWNYASSLIHDWWICNASWAHALVVGFCHTKRARHAFVKTTVSLTHGIDAFAGAPPGAGGFPGMPPGLNLNAMNNMFTNPAFQQVDPVVVCTHKLWDKTSFFCALFRVLVSKLVQNIAMTQDSMYSRPECHFRKRECLAKGMNSSAMECVCGYDYVEWILWQVCAGICIRVFSCVYVYMSIYACKRTCVYTLQIDHTFLVCDVFAYLTGCVCLCVSVCGFICLYTLRKSFVNNVEMHELHFFIHMCVNCEGTTYKIRSRIHRHVHTIVLVYMKYSAPPFNEREQSIYKWTWKCLHRQEGVL